LNLNFNIIRLSILFIKKSLNKDCKNNSFKGKNNLKIIININNSNFKEYNKIKRNNINFFPLIYKLKIIILLKI